MALDPSKATKATKSQQTYTGAQPSSLTWPTNNGPFTAGTPVGPQAASSTVNANGPTDAFRTDPQVRALINSGIPQSYIDHIADTVNAGGDPYGNGRANTPQGFAQMVNQLWVNEPNKQQYVQQDAQSVTSNTTAAALRSAATIPQQNATVANNFYNKYTQPALNNFVSAQSDIKPADLQAEAGVQNATNQFTGTIQGNDAQRLGDTISTNNQVTGLTNQFADITNQTNAGEAGIYNTWIPNAQATNAADTGLAQNLWGATNSTNAANSQLGAGLMDAANSSNAMQTAALGQLLGQVQSSNSQQDAALAQVQGQFASLNASDQAAYMQYLQETNPLMAQLVAQGSDPNDISNQQDVMQRYKDLSNPQVTAAERQVASQARQSFEAQDRGQREAVMQQLLGRGLNSGGLQIANLQGAHEQTANDRMNAELGLEAQAQNRAMGALAGYGTEANTIRSADDAERNFQDIYKQNEAVRVGNLAQQRNNQSLQTNQAITNRDQAGFNDATTSINNNFARDYTGFQATSQTANDSYYRTSDATKTGVDINQKNLGNTQFATTTNIGVNDNNDARLRQAGKDTITGMQTTLGNTGVAIGGQLQALGDNWNRLDSGSGTLAQNNSDAGAVLGAQTTAATLPAANRQREANNASGALGTVLGAGGQISGTQQGLSADQLAALARVLQSTNASTATTVAASNN